MPPVAALPPVAAAPPVTCEAPPVCHGCGLPLSSGAEVLPAVPVPASTGCWWLQLGKANNNGTKVTSQNGEALRFIGAPCRLSPWRRFDVAGRAMPASSRTPKRTPPQSPIGRKTNCPAGDCPGCCGCSSTPHRKAVPRLAWFGLFWGFASLGSPLSMLTDRPTQCRVGLCQWSRFCPLRRL